MEIVKVRRVGNSNVITLPREMERYGFVEGAEVVIEVMPNGVLRLILAEKLRKQMPSDDGDASAGIAG